MEKRSYSKILNNSGRTIVVGDIHGCFKELMLLLKKVSFSSDDILITVGDFMDRGQNSWQVAEFLRDTVNAFSVSGNHERRIAGVIRGTSHPAWTQKHTLLKMDGSRHSEWADYFESLPAVIETESVIVTHARLDPDRGLNDQNIFFTAAVGGRNAVIDLDENGVPVWFNEWKKKQKINKPVCIGHISYSRTELLHKELYSLDTGAVTGGFLTALIFPDFDLVQVPSENYYEKSLSEWRSHPLKDQGARSVTIGDVAALIKKENKEAEDIDIIDEFTKAMVESGLEHKLIELKRKLIDKYGKVPPPGKEKGQFFIQIKKENSVYNYPLIKHIMISEHIELENVLKICAGMSLQKLEREIQLLFNV